MFIHPCRPKEQERNSLFSKQILQPELPVRSHEMIALGAPVAVHAVRIYHQLELLALVDELVHKL